MTLPRVLALVDSIQGCNLWRIFQPFAALQRRGYPSEWIPKDHPNVPEYALGMGAEAVVLPRMSWDDRGAGERFISVLHRHGMAVIAEFDDDLFSPHVNNRIRQTVLGSEDLSDELLERRRLDRLAALRLCDGVTVSSQRLATVVRQLIDKPVMVVPNAIDVAWWRAVWKRRERLIPGLTIGWSGGKRPDADFGPLAEAWGRLARRYPHVTFAVGGHCSPLISAAVPKDRLKGLPWLPIDLYPLSFMQFDISCCAVDDTAFNRCKTPIKVWESTLARATVVATPTLYGQAVDNGVDGLLAETADEWELALAGLIEHPEQRRRLWRNQRRRVAERHSLEANLWRWPAAWGEIVERFRLRRRLVA